MKRHRSVSLPSCHLPSVALFIFRRDLRITDNTGLKALCDAAARRSLPVLPVFFFNPVQCDKSRNPYFGAAFFQFFCESLQDLNGPKQLNGRLACLRGGDVECITQIEQCGFTVQMLGYNEDFTPFALTRDERLSNYAAERRIPCVTGSHDYTLLPLDAVVNGSGQPYSVFTPFSHRLLAEHATAIAPPLTNDDAIDVVSTFYADAATHLKELLVDPATLCIADAARTEAGGRTAGLHRLSQVPHMRHYEEERNSIADDRTSHLSPHLKCGTISIREVWYASVTSLGLHHAFTRQLIWREFYAMLAFEHPRLLQGQLNAFAEKEDGAEAKKSAASPQVNAPYLAKYNNFAWKWDPAHFEAFRSGQTGVPLVDAAVRCLTATGWCHNRCRMVIANFAVKVLSIDWRECERWYATVAVDYDVANNNGGWLWSSGQGADAQPYFRTFNPFRQSERFDPDGAFIFKWVPELRSVPPRIVHNWDAYCEKQARASQNKRTPLKKRGKTKDAPPTAGEKKQSGDVGWDTTYPPPIVDIKARTKAVIEKFKAYEAVK